MQATMPNQDKVPLTPTPSSVIKCATLSQNARKDVLYMTHRANASHVGSCLSIIDVLSVLYEEILRITPETLCSKDRDRFILSKGHAAAALYSVLVEKGFFNKYWLDEYCNDGTMLGGHATSNVPGVEVSTGALGHGLSIGCGMALSAKIHKQDYRVFVLLGDGECDEGSIWEPALFAPHQKLDNLTVIIDYNRIQSFGRVDAVLSLDPLADKWRSFGWNVKEVDGHNISELLQTFSKLPFEHGLPSCIIAHTVKGKGVSFMEDKLEWHYKSPDKHQLELALKEVDY